MIDKRLRSLKNTSEGGDGRPKKRSCVFEVTGAVHLDFPAL